jgi:SSS family solute:Na+ symporter/sodium/proline symporter
LEYLAMLFLMGPKLRRFSIRRGAITIPEYLEARFRDSRNVLRGTCAAAIVVFMTAYLVSQYVGMSFTITQVLQWPLVPAIILTALVIGTYTMLGGYKAVVYTDVLQGCIMLMAMLIVPFLAWRSAGGLRNVVETLDQIGGAGLSGVIGSAGVPFAMGMLFAGLGAFGNPHIIIRYMSVRSARDFNLAAFVNLIFNVVIAWGGMILGLAGRALYHNVSVLPFQNSEMVFFHVGRAMIPSDLLLGILWAGVFAAMMSSASGMMLAITSSVTRDFYENILKANANIAQAKLVRLNRVVVAAVVMISLLLTFLLEKKVLMLALFAWGGLGGALGPVVLLSLWWPRMTKWGALAGLLGGIAMAVTWRSSTALTAILVYEALPAFVFALILAFLVSLATSPPRDPELENDLRLPGGVIDSLTRSGADSTDRRGNGI